MASSTFLKSAAWGVAGGILLILILGFWLAGWYTVGLAQKLAADSADEGAVNALAPTCAADFQSAATGKQKATLAKAAAYDRGDVFRTVVAAIPGQKETSSPLAHACRAGIQQLAAAIAAR